MKKHSKKKENNAENIGIKNDPLYMDLEPPKRYYYDNNTPAPSKQKSAKHYTKNEIRKKQNKKRKMKRGFVNAIIGICIFAVVIIITIVLSLTIFFNVAKINVSGSGTYSEEQIEEVCGIEAGSNLFLIDRDKCRQKLTQKLPYVYDVQFKIKLPETLDIEITDATVSYSISNGDETFTLLDDMLKVLENDAKEISENSIVIKDAMLVGSDAGSIAEFENEETNECIKNIADAIKKVGLSDVSEISCTDKNNNSLLYKNRIIFKLGDSSDLENKLYKGLAACDELEKRSGSVKGTLNISTGKEIYFTEE